MSRELRTFQLESGKITLHDGAKPEILLQLSIALSLKRIADTLDGSAVGLNVNETMFGKAHNQMTTPTTIFHTTTQDGEEPNSWIHPENQPENVLVRFYHPMCHEELAIEYCHRMNNPSRYDYDLWKMSVDEYHEELDALADQERQARKEALEAEVAVLSKPKQISWIITQDHQEPKDVNPVPWHMSDRGVGNYPAGHTMKADRWEALSNMPHKDVIRALPWEFRIHDDDLELYYSGRANSFDFGEDEAFQPLNWATNHAGCTHMTIRDPATGEWKVL